MKGQKEGGRERGERGLGGKEREGIGGGGGVERRQHIHAEEQIYTHAPSGATVRLVKLSAMPRRVLLNAYEAGLGQTLLAAN